MTLSPDETRAANTSYLLYNYNMVGQPSGRQYGWNMVGQPSGRQYGWNMVSQQTGRQAAVYISKRILTMLVTALSVMQ